VIVGVAGAGKTTALDAAATALTGAGFTVLGSATSGQAARTLGTEADINSRTVTSLLWRLDHRQLELHSGCVVILDEAAMTADADLLRLTVGVQRAGAKLVLVGDPYQLSAIGPGGALDAVIDRHPHIVTTLDGNVRQYDPHERAALARLRDGSVPDAVGWYARTGRTRTAPTRTETLVGMVNEWASDVSSGHDAALLAWRRADVADLNRLARAHWDHAGRLTGPELEAPGGRRYAQGDRVVFLAPVPDAGLVTSQRGTINAVDVDHETLVIDVGRRRVTLSGEAIDAQHLDHGYATTVHRAQGATYDRAHALATGGGRELGYVAMSRARDQTTIHAVADDLPQAIEDLNTDWNHQTRQRWITRTAAPVPKTKLARPVDLDRPAQLARLQAERDQLLALVPPDVQSELTGAVMRRTRIQDDLRDLKTGHGRWQHSDVGAAAHDLNEAGQLRRQAETFAAMPTMPRRMRRAWRKDIGRWTEQETLLQEQWREIGGPVLERLTTQLADADLSVEQLTQRRDARRDWLRAHPELEHRLRRIDRELAAHITPAIELDRSSTIGRSRQRAIEGPDLGMGPGL
jgi:hypothetical protein